MTKEGLDICSKLSLFLDSRVQGYTGLLNRVHYLQIQALIRGLPSTWSKNQKAWETFIFYFNSKQHSEWI